jgi:Calpain family cysteine protease
MACTEPSWQINAGAYGTPDFRDPVQGVVLKNCSLIAAFASLALKQKLSAQQLPYQFTFYDVNSSVPTTIVTNNDLPTAGYATSDTPKIWPAVYEKAYYQWLENPLKPPSHPHYCNYIGWQNPVTVLKQLTGKNPFQQNCLNANQDTVFSLIDSLCADYRSITNRIIKYPAVAWTNDSGTQYADNTITAQHSYSLLGVTGTKTAPPPPTPPAWITKYVVLRNPYGKGKGDPAIPGYLFTGTWYNINLGEKDGVFAISADQFVKYFTGYAWTV